MKPEAMVKSRVVMLTGADISAESGIKTFRAADGLWGEHRVEDVVAPGSFARDPALVQALYNVHHRQLQSPEIMPNAARLTLTRPEDLLDNHFSLAIQSINNLHERASNRRVTHMYGELLKVCCSWSGQMLEWTGDVTAENKCHCCQFPATLRPHVVRFGEMPLGTDEVYSALTDAGIFTTIGTSGHVYPTADFVYEARLRDAHTVGLSPEPSQVGSEFTKKYYGLVSEVVPAFIGKLPQESPL